MRQFIIALLSILAFTVLADNDPDIHPMTNERLGEIIQRLDKKAESPREGFWQFQIRELTVSVITDENANRMRIIIPILEAQQLNQEALYRIMQANFDSTLDARYAIANKILWSAYIHPLASLNDEEFLLGLGQAINLVLSFGSTYSSGLLTFGGGDSNNIIERELIEQLLEDGLAI